MIGCVPKEANYPVPGAHEDQDLYFLGSMPDEIFIKATQGDYTVFLPNDIHHSGTVMAKAEACRKVVVKVSAGTL